MNHMWSHIEGQSASEETEATRTGDRTKLKHPGKYWLEQANRLWNKDDEKGVEDKLRLAGFPPPASSSSDSKPVRLNPGKKKEQSPAEKQKQTEWSDLPGWDEEKEEAEASSSWEPHSEQGSETGHGDGWEGEAEAEPEGADGPPQKRKRGHRGGWKHKKWWEKYPKGKGGKGGRSSENRWEW